MKKLLFILILIFSATVRAADTEVQDLVELTAIASADVFYIVDDPAGAPASRKITALNLFDMIDTFAELNAIVANKTVVNEEDAVTWDALGTFSLGITITTGDPFTLGAVRWDNGSDLMDGEKIAADTIDDDSIDFADITGADFTLTDCGAITASGLITANAGIVSASASATPLVDLNPAHTNTATVLDITPSAAISTNEADWNGIIINGAALDPSGDDVLICGAQIDLSGVVPSGSGGDIDGIKLTMSNGEKHAIHSEEGKIVIDNTAGSAAGAEYTVIDIRLDTSSLNANSDIHAIDVAVEAGTPAGDVVAVGTHSNVAPIRQGIGIFSTPNQTEYAGEKHTGGTVWADGVDGSEIFVADDDAVYVGSTAVFNEIEVDMATAATKSVTPTFHYNTAADTWTEFFPADDTDGFQQDGTIRWTLADISGSWTNNGDPGGADSSAGYWIKIVRTANADPGTPTPTTVKTGVITTYFWDKTGAMDVLSLEADTITEGGVAVHNNDQMDASSELLAIFDDETGTGVIVFGTAPTFTTSITITGADHNPAAAGEIRYDNTITGIMSGGGLRWYDDDSVRLLVDLETDPSNDDYVVAYDSTADGFYMKQDADSGGATAWDDIGDPDNSGLTTITFDNAELSLLTGDNDATASFFTIQNSDADHTGGNLYLLDLDYSADDGDVDADFIKCQDSGGVVFSVQQDGELATDGGVTAGGAVEGATITEGGTAVHNNDEMDASSELLAIFDDETGTGVIVFGTSPSFTTSILAVSQADIGSTTAEFGDIFIGDGKAIKFGDDQDVTLTHVADTGVQVELDDKIMFGDTAVYIHSDDDGYLDIEADTAIRMDGPVDMQANALDCDSSTVTLSTVAGAIDAGGATSLEIPNAADPDVDAAGEITNDTDGANETGDVIIRGFDGTNQFPVGRKLRTINFTLIEPDLIDAADLIPVWHNTSGMTFTIVEWKAWSDDDNVSFEIEELTDQTDYTARTQVDACEIATDGTGVFYGSDATITHAAIEHDHSLAIDFDASDTPDYVQISITGWFNADVN